MIQFDFSITGEHEPNDDECQWPSDDEGKYIFYLLQAARDQKPHFDYKCAFDYFHAFEFFRDVQIDNFRSLLNLSWSRSFLNLAKISFESKSNAHRYLEIPKLPTLIYQSGAQEPGQGGTRDFGRKPFLIMGGGTLHSPRYHSPISHPRFSDLPTALTKS